MYYGPVYIGCGFAAEFWWSGSTVWPLLLAKLDGFLLLLALASINKWRLVPAIERGDLRGAVTVSLRKTLISEYILTILMFIFTAVLTTFTSPPADFGIDEGDDPDVFWKSLGRWSQSRRSGITSVVRFLIAASLSTAPTAWAQERFPSYVTGLA